MKTITKVFLTFLLAFLTLTGCRDKPQQTSHGLRIVTSFYPIYAMTKEVSGHLNDVRMIQSGSGIHDFEPSVSDVRAIYDADMFIYHSHILESWAGRLDASLENSEVIIVEASTGMSLERVPGLEDIDIAEGFEEATLYDPHTWVDPVLVAEEVRLIAVHLSQLDPNNAQTYKKNAENMARKAEKLAEKFSQRFANIKHRTFVTQHTAFSYVAKRFDLEQLGIAGVNNQEPSPRQLAEIKDFIDTYKIKTIFTEKGSSDKLFKAVSNSAKVQLKVLDPLEADPQNQLSYLENLETNLTVLAQELDN